MTEVGNLADETTAGSFLIDQGGDDIELLIATHPHKDHIGGIPNVLNMFDVESIIDSVL